MPPMHGGCHRDRERAKQAARGGLTQAFTFLVRSGVLTAPARPSAATVEAAKLYVQDIGRFETTFRPATSRKSGSVPSSG